MKNEITMKEKLQMMELEEISNSRTFRGFDLKDWVDEDSYNTLDAIEQEEEVLQILSNALNNYSEENGIVEFYTEELNERYNDLIEKREDLYNEIVTSFEHLNISNEKSEPECEVKKMTNEIIRQGEERLNQLSNEEIDRVMEALGI